MRWLLLIMVFEHEAAWSIIWDADNSVSQNAFVLQDIVNDHIATILTAITLGNATSKTAFDFNEKEI